MAFTRRLRRKIVSVVLIGGERRERDALPSCSGAFLRSLAKVTGEVTSSLGSLAKDVDEMTSFLQFC